MTGFDFTRNQKLALYVLIGLSAIGLSVTHVRSSLGGGDEVVLREPGEAGSPRAVAADSDPMPGYGPSSNMGKAVFQVAGCVKRPGVYSLAEDKRIIDAISAAGGAKPNADLQALSLAAKIEDGSRIYVPPKGEAGVPIRITTVKPAGEMRHRSSGSSSDKLRNPGEGVVHITRRTRTSFSVCPGLAHRRRRRSSTIALRSAGSLASSSWMISRGLVPRSSRRCAHSSRYDAESPRLCFGDIVAV